MKANTRIPENLYFLNKIMVATRNCSIQMTEEVIPPSLCQRLPLSEKPICKVGKPINKSKWWAMKEQPLRLLVGFCPRACKESQSRNTWELYVGSRVYNLTRNQSTSHMYTSHLILNQCRNDPTANRVLWGKKVYLFILWSMILKLYHKICN